MSEETGLLETRIRHLLNELELTRKEYEDASTKYLELYSDMERKVLEKTHELKELLQRFKEKNQILEIILNSSPGMIYFKDSSGSFVEVNRRFAATLGLSPSQIIGKTYGELYPGLQNPLLDDDEEVVSSGVGESGRTATINTGNGEVPVIVDKVPLKDLDGKVRGVIGFVQDISELKKAEEEIKTSLMEKEILLKEVQHRVKNNLQVIASLIDMESRATSGRQTNEILGEIRNRVYTMALIHTLLYEGGRYDRVDMSAFVNSLVGRLLQVYRPQTRISPVVGCSGVFLPIKQAIPCGLVVNELVSNCFKHAFKGRETGEIRVLFTQTTEGRVSLTISDDGVGLTNGNGSDGGDGLGLTLARLLVREQLKGSIDVTAERGTRIDIGFAANGQG